MKTVFIYELIDPRTNEPRYVGKTINIKNRLKSHLLYDKAKTYKNNWIKNLLKENLVPKLNIIARVNENEWEYWEKYYIKLYKEKGYKLTNATEGGDNPPSNRGRKVSEEEKKRRSKIAVFFWKNHPEIKKQISKKMTGIKRTQKTKQKISKKLKGRKMSEEQKKLISLANKNKKRTQEQKQKISKKLKGIVKSKEHIEKIKLTKIKNNTLNLICSEETKRKIGEANKKPKPERTKVHCKNISLSKIGKSNIKIRKPIIQYDLNENFIKEWESASQASKELKIDNGYIVSCCKGKQKQCKGFVFKYKIKS